MISLLKSFEKYLVKPLLCYLVAIREISFTLCNIVRPHSLNSLLKINQLLEFERVRDASLWQAQESFIVNVVC